MAAPLQMVAGFVPIGDVQGLHKNPVLIPLAEPPLLGREEIAAVSSQLARLVQLPNILPEEHENSAGAIDLQKDQFRLLIELLFIRYIIKVGPFLPRKEK
jgi:hypothetical protein